jgi:hypothetical protein
MSCVRGDPAVLPKQDVPLVYLKYRSKTKQLQIIGSINLSSFHIMIVCASDSYATPLLSERDLAVPYNRSYTI